MKKKELTVQVLVATMNQENFQSLPQYLNLQTEAIIGNQCTHMTPVNNFYHGSYLGNDMYWLNFQEKGVGLNRNNALMRATSDIVVFSDDDMTFIDGYEEIVVSLFLENPKADIIIFNIIETPQKRRRTLKAHYTKKCGYGCARIACRRESIMKHGIFFNLNYGGGGCYSHGEDSIFLSECKRKGLKILLVPESIARLNESRESTWFKGYNDKYYYDKGNLLAAMGTRFILLRIFYRFMRGHFTSLNIHNAKLIYKGYLDYKKNNKLNIYENSNNDPDL